MKRVLFILSALAVFSSVNAYSLDTGLLEARNKIFNESGQIKLFLNNTRDVIIANSMWDTCVITITQLDAYFSMLGIFNTVKEDEAEREALQYLTDWLSGIKNTGELNMKSLDAALKNTIDDKTRGNILRLKNHYRELNRLVDAELGKVSAIRDSLKLTNKLTNK